MPRKVYENQQETIDEAKLAPKALLTVKELDWFCGYFNQNNNKTKQKIIAAKSWLNI